MKAFLLVLVLAATASAWYTKNYDEFLAHYGKHYTGAEYHTRAQNFRDALKRLDAMLLAQKPGDTVEWGVTKFFDMSMEEFRSTMLSPRAPTHLAQACLETGDYQPLPAVSAPSQASFDWRKYPNVVLPVENQASCGSCWAFSTAENLEGQNGIANNKMAGIQLSPQYIVDCSKGCSSEMYMGANTTVCNGGCNGGWPWTALDDVTCTSTTSCPTTTYGIAGLPSLTSYPYRGVTMTCKTPTAPLTYATGYDCVSIKCQNSGQEDCMADYLVAHGPLSIAVDADPFYYYSSGVIPATQCPQPTTYLDHAILAVGYDTTQTPPYWIVKNSWDVTWGIEGYVYMEYGTGCCGIDDAATCATGSNVI